MPWHLELTRRAAKDLDALSSREREAVEQRLEHLADDLGSVDVTKLSGRSDQWRLRMGRWRVILQMDNSKGTLYALRVLPRSEAYRD